MRLIDADKCISEIKNNLHFYGYEHTRDGLLRAVSYIIHTPTIDPVKHGYWIETEIPDYRCSCCGACEDTHAPYCRMCGARMDGDKDETD